MDLIRGPKSNNNNSLLGKRVHKMIKKIYYIKNVNNFMEHQLRILTVKMKGRKVLYIMLHSFFFYLACM